VIIIDCGVFLIIQPKGKIMTDENAIDPIALSVPEAAKFVGLGRSSIQKAVNKGELRSAKYGKRRLITKEALKEWIQHLEAQTSLKPKE
jgi:excisionase family DNA binding protein